MVKRLAWLEHAGQEILQLDVEGAGREEQLAALEDYAKAVKNRPPNSVLLLLKGGNIDFYPEVLTRARAVFNAHADRVRRSAVVGADGILKVAVQGYRQAAELMGRDMAEKARFFDLEAEALAWLVGE
jgi:hypothetical protein